MCRLPRPRDTLKSHFSDLWSFCWMAITPGCLAQLNEFYALLNVSFISKQQWSGKRDFRKRQSLLFDFTEISPVNSSVRFNGYFHTTTLNFWSKLISFSPLWGWNICSPVPSLMPYNLFFLLTTRFNKKNLSIKSSSTPLIWGQPQGLKKWEFPGNDMEKILSTVYFQCIYIG